MQLSHMTWQEVEAYLSCASGVLIGTGSTEQHGPIGLIGTDTICADSITAEVAKVVDAVAAPSVCYTPAPFNTCFPGTMSITAGLFSKLLSQLFSGLLEQGFKKIYVVNGHGANLEPLAEVIAEFPTDSIRVRSWWEFDNVQRLRDQLFGDWEGMHATPSEVAITQHLTGIVHAGAEAPPRRLSAEYILGHLGDRHGPPGQHRADFPDGRVGSHSALARPEHGALLFNAAVAAVGNDYREWVV